MQELPQDNTNDQEITLREQIETYLRFWPWFIFSALVLFIGANIYLRYVTPTYKSTATILIKDSKNNALSELSAFQDLGVMGTFSGSEFDNELEILRSKNLMEKVVEALNLNVTYFKEGNVRTSEVYTDRPFTVNIVSASKETSAPGGNLYIKPISLTKFTLQKEEETATEYEFGEVITMEWGKIMLTPNVEVLKRTNTWDQVSVLIRNKEAVASSLRGQIEVTQVSKNSSVIRLDLISATTEKAQDILNELIVQYNIDAVNDRNMVSQNTADFIQSRLQIITEELDSVETGKVRFKEDNKLTDINAEGQLFLENASEFNKRQLEVETQIQLVNTMRDYLVNIDTGDLLPANLGIEKEGFSNEIEAYNNLVLQRNKLLQSSTPKNPVVVGIESQIADLRGNVMTSLQNVKTSLDIQKRRIGGQEAMIGGAIRQIPAKEKEFRSISRQQEIKESLYLYLLQKREETAISLAVTTPKAKVVDKAYSGGSPVSPKRQIVLLASLIVGLLIPFSIIYITQLLDNKIRDRAYVERFGNNIRILGEIPKIGKKDNKMVQANDHTILAESFRILRTTLQYLFVTQKSEDEGKIIFVTSTVQGEGKTFTSVNLALTLANTGSKVILVGADIRNPQIQKYVRGEHLNKGVVEYLINREKTVRELVQYADLQESLAILASDTIPPNPAELWMHNRAKELFAELKQEFDFVVVDTAPSMMVTDTLLINKYADVTLYVIRAGYTEKKLLEYPIESLKENKLENIAFVLNDVDLANFGYGNKYGYTYGSTKRTFWDKFFRRH